MGLQPIATAPHPQQPGDDGWPEGRELYPDELETLAKVRIPTARDFLEAFASCWSIAHALRAVGRTRRLVYYWKDTDPAFAQLYEDLLSDQQEAWRAHAAHKARSGFHKVVYDKDGNVKAHEIREDPGHLKAMMASIDPDWRGDAGSGNITINVVRVRE